MKKLTLVFVLLFVLILVGCGNVPEYKNMPSTPQKGNMMELNGVIYKMQPETAWRPLDWNGIKLVARSTGFNWKSDVFMFPADTGHIFLMEQLSESGFRDVGFRPNYYYKEDITLPPYDRNGVNMLGFKKEGSSSDGVFSQNEALIDEIFKLKNNAQADQTVDFDFVFELQLMNSNYSGIGIKVNVYQKNSTYWICFNEFSNVISPISQELLEQIAGEKLPAAI